MCVFWCGIRLHRGPVWCSDITLATRIARIILSRGMASTSIPPMDITGSKSELSERWRVWLRGFTYFAEGKANLQNAVRKKSELLYRAGSGVQDIFENLTIVPPPEGQEGDDVYQQTVRTLNAYFQVQENAAYERHVLASYAKNLEKMSTHFCFDSANKQDTAAMGKRNSNSP